MLSASIEGSIGYLVSSTGVKHAFSCEVKEVTKLLANQVTYITREGKSKTRLYLDQAGSIAVFSEYDLN